MKQRVYDVANCDDLMMNLLVQKYYPYFLPYPVYPKNFELGNGPNAISRAKQHYAKRHDCLRFFS